MDDFLPGRVCLPCPLDHGHVCLFVCRANLEHPSPSNPRRRGLPYMTSTEFWDFFTLSMSVKSLLFSANSVHFVRQTLSVCVLAPMRVRWDLGSSIDVGGIDGQRKRRKIKTEKRKSLTFFSLLAVAPLARSLPRSRSRSLHAAGAPLSLLYA